MEKKTIDSFIKRILLTIAAWIFIRGFIVNISFSEFCIIGIILTFIEHIHIFVTGNYQENHPKHK
jgi:hypothetical protein